MSEAVHAQVKAPPAPAVTPTHGALLQRKCACGGTRGLDGECEECRRKRLAREGSPLIQTKLQIGRAGDRNEKEADRLAEQVMRIPESRIQPQIEPEARARKELIRAKGARRQVAESLAESPVGIQTRSGRGKPLPVSIRSFFEHRFGSDFGQVRIHTDSHAGEASRSINAQAFTFGRDIFFDDGQFEPSTNSGKRLLAHELAHVVQHRNSQPRINRQKSTKGRKKYLRQIRVQKLLGRPNVFSVPDAAIKETEEYKSYMNSRLVWQWRDAVTEEEALLACRGILLDIKKGERVDWPSEARVYMRRARSILREVSELQLETGKQVRMVESVATDLPARQPEPEPSTEQTEKEVDCGELSKGSVVFKGTGKVKSPTLMNFLGDEWELRFVQRGECCRTYILRVKKTALAKRTAFRRFLFEGKVRGDLRLSRNICTNKQAVGGRMSWEGKLTLFNLSKLEKGLQKLAQSSEGAEIVVKPQVGFNFDSPKDPSKDLRVTLFIKVRAGVEISVGNQVIVELRYHAFECDIGAVEIGLSILDMDVNADWELRLDKCMDEFVDGLTSSIPSVKIRTPTIPRPWYERSDDIGRLRF